MNIDAIMPPLLTPSINTIESGNPSGSSFSDWLTNTIGATNQQLLAADTALNQLASGQAVSLHQTMLSLEEAKLSFQYMEQIRNRLMTAYQDILREQI